MSLIVRSIYLLQRYQTVVHIFDMFDMLSNFASNLLRSLFEIIHKVPACLITHHRDILASDLMEEVDRRHEHQNNHIEPQENPIHVADPSGINC